jgi:hypothetical protein
VSSIRGDLVQGRAGALVDRRLVGRVIGLIDHDRLENELVGRGLLAQMAHRDLGADAAWMKPLKSPLAKSLPDLISSTASRLPLIPITIALRLAPFN